MDDENKNKYLPKKPSNREAAGAFGAALIGLAACIDRSLIMVAAFPALLMVMAAAWPGEITPKVGAAGFSIALWTFMAGGFGFLFPLTILMAASAGFFSGMALREWRDMK